MTGFVGLRGTSVALVVDGVVVDDDELPIGNLWQFRQIQNGLFHCAFHLTSVASSECTRQHVARCLLWTFSSVWQQLEYVPSTFQIRN